MDTGSQEVKKLGLFFVGGVFYWGLEQHTPHIDFSRGVIFFTNTKHFGLFGQLFVARGLNQQKK